MAFAVTTRAQTHTTLPTKVRHENVLWLWSNISQNCSCHRIASLWACFSPSPASWPGWYPSTCQAVSRGYSQAFGWSLLRLCCTWCSINSHLPCTCFVPGWCPSWSGDTRQLLISRPPWTPTGSTPTTDCLASGYTCLSWNKSTAEGKGVKQSSWLQIFSLVLIKAQVDCYSAFQSCFIFFPCIHSTRHPAASLPRCTPTTKLILSTEPLEPLWLSELSLCL